MKKYPIYVYFLNYLDEIEKDIAKYVRTEGLLATKEGLYTVYQNRQTVFGVSKGDLIEIYYEVDDYTKEVDRFSKCPLCKGRHLKPTIMLNWKSERLSKLYNVGIIDYWPGHMPMGYKKETRTCLDCGCKWQNTADINYWNNIYKAKRDLSDRDLGIEHLGLEDNKY